MSESTEIVVPWAHERYVMVGDRRQHVGLYEWIALQLEPGERVRITPGSLTAWHRRGLEPFEARVEFTWFYDGVVLEMTEIPRPALTRFVPAPIRCTAHPEWDKIEPLDRRVRMGTVA